MLAVAGVASTTLIASGVAWWSFGRVEATLDSVTRNSLPAIASSLQLAERATGITGAAPRILATATQEEREAAVAAVQNGVDQEIGRASCRERECQYVYISVVAASLKKQIKKER